MGTKNNPGKFDCYSRAEPDEPVFVLLGRDPVASSVVNHWIYLRECIGKAEPEVLAEAAECAEKMQRWARSKGKGNQIVQALEYAEQMIEVLECAKEDGFDRLFERVRELEALCGRAADIIAEQVSTNVYECYSRQEFDDLVRELRGA